MPVLVRPLLLPLLAVPTLAYAEVPSVAVDIPPVHALASQVMGDLGAPELVIRPGASPHGYSMRPSEAASLDRAEVVFWVGPALTPWLGRSIDSLADDAVALLEAPGLTRYDVRQSATFEAHGHGDEAGHGGHHPADHDHAGLDPHAWLDPRNARVWLGVMAETLAKADPEHAATYRDNARRGQAELAQLSKEVEERLVATGKPHFIVFHDAYQYFERRFGVPAAGAISLGDASDPSPSRVREIQRRVEALDIDCVFTEPQYNPQLVESVFGGTAVDTSRVIDPLGVDLATGPGLYAELIRQLSDGLAGCRQD
ncbi:zinc ABC transporter substrate-binding protein [Halomonas nitroreducens]|uniref:High-affinity zinc uptake system protein ZnuA n=1 Tax=Halomonas nitroreducens TaxID=447425 RepID=A0A3S0HRP5_9GAMM|nr:zinc ABC transporter substrate-binding protein [Halomonas nitroreducens]RTR05939.1 zinc transporter [Halomonas nitroreducens]